MPLTRLTQLEVQEIRNRWDAEGMAFDALPHARADVRKLLRELDCTVVERDTARIERDEALARERGMVAELNGHLAARGLLEED